MNILLCFTFFFIVSSFAAPILDQNGDEVKPGVQYYMIQDTLFNPPYISLSTTGHCPAKVTQLPYNILYPRPLPVTLHPIDKDVQVITDSTKLNIRSEGAELCLDYSQVWKVSSDQTRYITGDGEIGDHKSSVFSFRKVPSGRSSYNIFFCPQVGAMCSFAGIDTANDVVITGFFNNIPPVPVVLVKNNVINSV